MKKLLSILCISFSFTLISQPYPADEDKGYLENIWIQLNQPTLSGWDFNPAAELNNTWEGITMTPDGLNISSISLINKGLTGTLSAKLGSLDELKVLNLKNNEISGSIPPNLGNASKLITLNLFNNELSGSIHSQLGDLIQLQVLDLGANNLSGTIPSSLGNLTEIISLYFDSNALTGSIPSAFGGFSQLQTLFMSNNQFSGCLPSSFLAYCSNATVLLTNNPLMDNDDFNEFCLTGTGVCSCHPDIDALLDLYNSTDGPNWTDNNGWVDGAAGNNCDPCSWAGVHCNDGDRVRSLVITDNGLSGSIPSSFGNLNQLDLVNLIFNELSGTLPPEMGNLSQLIHLFLDNNQFSGTIPPELSNLSQLTRLNLNHNEFSGNIPPELGSLPSLIKLNLAVNELSGTIPIELGDFNQLEFLGLTGNDLTGVIPDELGNLSQLTTLSLSGNQFSGSIPVALSNLSELQSLNVANNQLSGNIPPELGNLGQLTSLNLDNNQLTGSIPPELSNLDQLSIIRLSINQLSGSIPSELSNLNMLTYMGLDNNQLTGCIPSSFQVFCPDVDVRLHANPFLDTEDFDDFCATGNGSCNGEITLNIKMFLQGPYDEENGNMNDILRTKSSFSIVSPYDVVSGEIIDPYILMVDNNNAIIDWVLVEILDGDDPSQVLETKSALLQKDGDVVSFTDGMSLLKFPGSFSNTTVVVGISHRNHLGIRHVIPVNLNGQDDHLQIDFTNLLLTIAGGEDAAANISGVRALCSGDANGDGQINANDKNNFWRPANGQPYEYFFSSGDFNLDGVVNTSDRNLHWRVNNGKASFLD